MSQTCQPARMPPGMYLPSELHCWDVDRPSFGSFLRLTVVSWPICAGLIKEVTGRIDSAALEWRKLTTGEFSKTGCATVAVPRIPGSTGRAGVTTAASTQTIIAIKAMDCRGKVRILSVNVRREPRCTMHAAAGHRDCCPPRTDDDSEVAGSAVLHGQPSMKCVES